MGKDITVYVEVRDNGKWNILPVKYLNKYAEEGEDAWAYAKPWRGRNSELFGILTRSYNNIDYPRGLPDDVSAEVKAERDKWFYESDVDGTRVDGAFDDTWFTLSELMLAVRDRKKYPKWYKFKDEFGAKQREAGPYWSLNGFVTAISNFVDIADGYYSPENVRAVMWFDN